MRYLILIILSLGLFHCQGSEDARTDLEFADMAFDRGDQTTADLGRVDQASQPDMPIDNECIVARRLFFEDFENQDYERWTSRDYGNDWGDECQSNGFSQEEARSGQYSHRSEITCSYPESHRGYGGVQFDGDHPLPAYTNQGSGTEAPYGVVNTYWSWLDVPYDFGGGRWFSFFTVNSHCNWQERVVTLGLEDPSRRVTPAHILNTGGTVDFAPDAPSFPLRQWVRTTVYLNFHEGQMHVWQDGEKLLEATFSRPSTAICHWHWGAYASGDNTDITLYEDDISIWKLEQPWQDFTVEPWLDVARICE